MKIPSFCIGAATLGLLLVCNGCSSFRVVKVVPGGGEVALAGDRDEARAKANEYMKSRCPAGFQVLEEGEAVVGENSTGFASRSFLPGVAHVNTSSTQKTEWRVKYQCQGDAPAHSVQSRAEVQEVVVRF